ncbi:hypothetical protein [Haloferula sp. BvORR071]|uniref:hypothetical protein n=1 Tax=Haloferula sp. BvORR071 TaxID=1396141 RepID=UPI000558DE93|nr:hypothetical protein [Haloferula sp. BvORR071]
MKRLIFALAALACLPLRADIVSDTYKQGVAALNDGNVEAAKISFNEVLRLQPGHANAQYQLKQLSLNQDSYAAVAREKELGRQVMPEINFDNVDADQAVLALGVMVEKKSGGKFAPNIMIQDPSKLLEQRRVTLLVKNMPASAALKMIAEQANAIVRYEKHAIVVTPRGGDAKKSEPVTSEKEDKPDPVK